MAVCSGCSSTECRCTVEGSGSITVTGDGSADTPYVVSAAIQALAVYTRTGELDVSAGAIRFRYPFAATLLGVTAAVGTAPVGDDLILDVNKNGTTIFTTQANRPTIADGDNATTTEPAPNVTAIVTGDYLTVDVDQIGSSTPGEDVTVFVRYSRP